MIEDDPENAVRLVAMHALGVLRPVSEETVDALIRALDSDDPHLIVAAAEILKSHPSQRGQAKIVPALATAIDRSDQWTGATGEAAKLLESYGPEAEAAVPAVLRALEKTGDWRDTNLYNALHSIATERSEKMIAASARTLPTHQAALQRVLQTIKTKPKMRPNQTAPEH